MPIVAGAEVPGVVRSDQAGLGSRGIEPPESPSAQASVQAPKPDAPPTNLTPSVADKSPVVALEGAWQPESLLAMEASKLGQSVVLPKEASQLESAEADGRRRRVEVHTAVAVVRLMSRWAGLSCLQAVKEVTENGLFFCLISGLSLTQHFASRLLLPESMVAAASSAFPSDLGSKPCAVNCSDRLRDVSTFFQKRLDDMGSVSTQEDDHRDTLSCLPRKFNRQD
ncbi:hypothetical protein AK812_SmicGene45010 [Symbiodinium microadriaticum]|uniref:Uncharacterized protein n=1 Tax=Symbiodinium microadriaticum TaxID=2951 RepID=A0A1Q9BX03_SYMMI|nr:hypothetical protein AK812_SmicGene45010 [Symbiodinium microadriaticum]